MDVNFTLNSVLMFITLVTSIIASYLLVILCRCDYIYYVMFCVTALIMSRYIKRDIFWYNIAIKVNRYVRQIFLKKSKPVTKKNQVRKKPIQKPSSSSVSYQPSYNNFPSYGGYPNSLNNGQCVKTAHHMPRRSYRVRNVYKFTRGNLTYYCDCVACNLNEKGCSDRTCKNCRAKSFESQKLILNVGRG